ncbi:hypothetical protein V8F20_002883 [Naviculisporaceae sp. PSN 640]
MEWTEAGARVFACAAVLSFIASIAVLLRFIVRGHILRVLGPTDWFLLLNLVFSYANTATVGFHVSRGLGRPSKTFTLEEKISYLQVTWVAIIIGNLSVILTKISILLLLLNIFAATAGTIWKITRGVLVVVVAYGIALTLTNIFNCSPVGSMGDYVTGSPKSKCVNLKAKWYADAGLNIVMDFVIFSLPIPVLRSMTLKWRQKIWLYGVFMLGFFVCVVSVIRLYYLWYAGVSKDPTTTGIFVTYWSTIELNVALVIACIPTLKPLVTKWCPVNLDSLGSNGRKRDGANSFDMEPGRHPPTISSPRVIPRDRTQDDEA